MPIRRARRPVARAAVTAAVVTTAANSNTPATTTTTTTSSNSNNYYYPVGGYRRGRGYRAAPRRAKSIAAKQGDAANNHNRIVYDLAKECKWEELKTKLDIMPNGAKYVDMEEGQVALHVVCSKCNCKLDAGNNNAGNNKPPDLIVVKKLLEYYPDAAMLQNVNGDLPIHLLCVSSSVTNYDDNDDTQQASFSLTKLAIIQAVLNVAPEAVQVANDADLKPLGVAYLNFMKPDVDQNLALLSRVSTVEDINNNVLVSHNNNKVRDLFVLGSALILASDGIRPAALKIDLNPSLEEAAAYANAPVVNVKKEAAANDNVHKDKEEDDRGGGSTKRSDKNKLSIDFDYLLQNLSSALHNHNNITTPPGLLELSSRLFSNEIALEQQRRLQAKEQKAKDDALLGITAPNTKHTKKVQLSEDMVLHKTISAGISWEWGLQSVVQSLLGTNTNTNTNTNTTSKGEQPEGIMEFKTRVGVSRLVPFLSAAVGVKTDLDTVWQLLRAHPDLVKDFIPKNYKLKGEQGDEKHKSGGRFCQCAIM